MKVFVFNIYNLKIDFKNNAHQPILKPDADS